VVMKRMKQAVRQTRMASGSKFGVRGCLSSRLVRIIVNVKLEPIPEMVTILLKKFRRALMLGAAGGGDCDGPILAI
jgi:hypothetical protein